MEIRINGTLAALKKGTSFEYVAENRLFSGSDGYTLSITFPLRHCPQNLDIFGHINRADVIAGKVIFDCEIRDKGFYKFGSITITEINDSEVKTQFLEGRSEQNFDKTFDKVYINELSLGYPSILLPSSISPAQAWSPIEQNFVAVALPWWNDSDSGLPHNFADFSGGKYKWASTTKDITWQPYLLHITKKICDAIGYTYDFDTWELSEEYRYLLICNSLPGAWDLNNFARALPHWTVDEFFEKLELFLNGEFNINHRDKSISFTFTNDILNNTKPVLIDKVVDEFSVEVSDDDSKCDYRETKNLVYKSSDYELWKYLCCDWFIDAMKDKIIEYNSMNDMLEDNKLFATWNGNNMRGSNFNKIFYIKNLDIYFIIRTVSRTEATNELGQTYYVYNCIPQPINIFGGRIVDNDEDADEIEIEFVPARIDDTEDKFGSCLFLSFAGYNEKSSGGYREEYDSDVFQKTANQCLIIEGKADKAEYYDSIFVGWWDGTFSNFNGKLPHPYVVDIDIKPDWSGYRKGHFSLRLNDKFSTNRKVFHKINKQKKTTFKFIADYIPDVRAVFFIQGKKYICEKITATFSENGMSQLLKGVFYQIED